VGRAWAAAGKGNTYELPTALLVGAKELPRSAQVEVQLVYGTGFRLDTEAPDEDGDDDDDGDTYPPTAPAHPYWVSKAFSISESRVKYEVRIPRTERDRAIGWIAFRNISSGTVENLGRQSMNELPYSPLHIRAFYTPQAPKGSVCQITEQLFGPAAPVTPLPAHFLGTSDGDFWDVLFCML